MSQLTPNREAQLREQYLDLRDHRDEARRLRTRYTNLGMTAAAREADRQFRLIEQKLAKVEAQLDDL